MAGRIIEGYWDCAFCDTKEIRGGLRDCPNCGKARDGDTKFKVNANSRVLSESEATKIDRDPDWECSFCGNLNPDESLTCISCGGNKADQEGTYFDARRKESEKETDAKEPENKDLEQEDLEHDVTFLHKLHFSSDFVKKLLLTIGVSTGIYALILLLSIIFTPKIETVTVIDFSWGRNIGIEELKTFEDSDWYLPSGARLLYKFEEISGYIDVIDHYETVSKEVSYPVFDHTEIVPVGLKDLGNGYFEEITNTVDVYRTEYKTEYEEVPVYVPEPIYDTKYYYEIDRWVVTRNLKTSGENKVPFWSDVNLLDDEYEGDRTESYSIIVKNEKDEEEKLSLDYQKWVTLEIGHKLTVQVVFGKIVKILKY